MMPIHNEEDRYQTAPESWGEYRRLVLQALKDLDRDGSALSDRMETNFRQIRENITKMEIDFTREITTLKVQAGMWGGIVGAIVSAIIAVVVARVIK